MELLQNGPTEYKFRLCSTIPHLNGERKSRRKNYDIPSFPKIGLEHGMVIAEHEQVISEQLTHFLLLTMHLHIDIRYNQTSIFNFVGTSSNLMLSALKDESLKATATGLC